MGKRIKNQLLSEGENGTVLYELTNIIIHNKFIPTNNNVKQWSYKPHRVQPVLIFGLFS